MIDGIKILRLPVERELLWNHPLLEPEIPVNAKSGELLNRPYEAKFRGLKFIFHPNRIELRGSMHKFFNNGLHNHNSFGLQELQQVLQELQDLLGINLEKARLNNLEIGVNVEPSCDTKRFLDSIIMHRSEQFSIQKSRKKFYRECVHHHYFLKAYDKALQFGLSNRNLRFEIKFVKMEKLNRIGIGTLGDTLLLENWVKLERLLIEKFDEVLFGDLSVDFNGLNSRDRELFIKGHNPLFWHELRPESTDKNYGNRYKTYERRLKRFKELLAKTGANFQKDEVRSLVLQKLNLLRVEKKRGKMTSQLELEKGKIDSSLYQVISRHWGLTGEQSIRAS